MSRYFVSQKSLTRSDLLGVFLDIAVVAESAGALATCADTILTLIY